MNIIKPQNFVIRLLTDSHDDYLAYSKLISQLTTQYKPYNYEIYTQMFNEIDQTIESIFVYESNKKVVVGTIKIIIEKKFYNENCYIGHIEDVVIDQFYRKYGLGRQLIDFAIDFCKTRSCYKIKLYCNKDTSPFYLKNGFSVAGIDLCKYLL